MQTLRIADNRMFHTGGRDFFFLAEDNAIFEMTPDTKIILEQQSAAGKFCKADFFSRLDGPVEDKQDLFETLMNRRVLVPGDRETSGRTTEAGTGIIPLKTLVLHLTDACNLGCHYCYYRQDGQASKKSRPMTPAVARKAVDFLLAHSGGLEEVVIVFFGGEPLLNFDLISFAVGYAREKALEKGKKIEFAITTNGTLLTDRIIGFLHEHSIGITVSIDGFEDVHDRFRRFPDGTPSYGTILPGIRKLIERAREKPVVARVTVAGRTARDVPEVLAHLLDLGFAEVGFAPVTTQDVSYQLGRDEMALLLDRFRALSDTFLDFARQDKFLGFTNLVDLLVVLHESEVKNYPCGAGLGLFSVDPEGRLYLCQRLTGEASAWMGDVSGGFHQRRIRQFRTAAEIGRKESCRKCWVRAICAGGCYHEALVREGGLDRPNLHYCEWLRNWIDIGLSVYGRLAAERPEYLDKLSMLRGHAPLMEPLL